MKLLLASGVLIGIGVAIIIWSRRQTRDDPWLTAKIKPPRVRYGKLPSAEYDALLQAAERRRVDAEELRRRAAQAYAGEPVLREVRRFRREA